MTIRALKFMRWRDYKNDVSSLRNISLINEKLLFPVERAVDKTRKPCNIPWRILGRKFACSVIEWLGFEIILSVFTWIYSNVNAHSLSTYCPYILLQYSVFRMFTKTWCIVRKCNNWCNCTPACFESKCPACLACLEYVFQAYALTYQSTSQHGS